MKKLRVILRKFPSFLGPFFGFLTPVYGTKTSELSSLKALIGEEDNHLVRLYEQEFAEMVGTGEAVSYAAARMGFYELMLSLGIGKGDEVVLLGMNCAVMPTAVIRAGATPVFSDVDEYTFGSSASNIKKVCNSNTKMVVAQHSFGIPCDIEEIQKYCESRGIFLLEDCALSLGSKINGKKIGTFGDASLFSTDHSKPLNTLVGGIVYSENSELVADLRERWQSLGMLPIAKQRAIYKRLVFESRWSKSRTYAFSILIDAIKYKFLPSSLNISPFLEEKEVLQFPTDYPYPSQMPSFLAALGRIQIAKRKIVTDQLTNSLQELVNIIKVEDKFSIPSCYEDPNREIIPLRLVTSPPNGSYLRNRFAAFLRVSNIWFMEPIIARGQQPLEAFGYAHGSCLVSEKLGKNMIQIPIPVSKKERKKLFKKISKSKI